MIFSKSARVPAIVSFVFGLLTALNGIAAGTGLMDDAATIARYAGRSPWGMIDRDIYTVPFSVALGTLAEISFSVRKMASLADFNFSMGKRAN
jgi:hypothetical protein